MKWRCKLSNRPSNWIPEICYEESDEGITSNIPFISVPPEEEMPKVIFIFESKETGEFEPGDDGSDLPVYEMNLHQFADMSTLKQKLSSEEYDRVRDVLGLEPLKQAARKGSQITDRIRNSLSSQSD